MYDLEMLSGLVLPEHVLFPFLCKRSSFAGTIFSRSPKISIFLLRSESISLPFFLFTLGYENERPLGMQDGAIKDDAITSNSVFDNNHFAHFGRLNQNQGYGGWCSSLSGPSPYLKIDFGTTMSVTAVATQGIYDTESKRNIMVATYQLEFQSSINGTWEKVNNTITGKAQVKQTIGELFCIHLI